MHSKIYALIFCLFLSNSNHNQAANCNQNHTKAINGLTHKQAGILYFTPTDNEIITQIQALTITHAHMHKIMGTEPSVMTLEKTILGSFSELDLFLRSQNTHLSPQFLSTCYKNCKKEHKYCKVFILSNFNNSTSTNN